MPPPSAPLWHTSAEEPALAPVRLLPQVDVAIVGAGYTGLSTALHCAEAGLGVQVIEAGAVGEGGSGRNVGLVNAGLWMPPAQLAAALGPDRGPRFVAQFAEAPARVFDLIEKHQIRCEATRTGTIHAAHGPSGLRDLRARHAEWARLGAPVDLLSASAVASLSGSRAFHGGLLDHRAGTVNPMGFARGLARAARGAGAEIATGTPATGLVAQGAGWRVETPAGPVEARHVVLATNAYTGGLWPGLARGFTTIHFVQAATEPLGQDADHILPERQGLWDTALIMSSLRRDAQGRLILGSMGRDLGGATRSWARAQLRRLFPELGAVQLAHVWDGRIAMTPDHLPRIHRLADGVWTPIGYNGRGITTGTLFGQAMAALLSGGDPADLPLPVSSPSGVAFGGLRSRVYDMAFTANQLWRGLRG